MTPLVPLGILFLLPLTAIAAILYVDSGIEPALFWSAVKTGTIIVGIGGLISFAASRLAERSNG